MQIVDIIQSGMINTVEETIPKDYPNYQEDVLSRWKKVGFFFSDEKLFWENSLNHSEDSAIAYSADLHSKGDSGIFYSREILRYLLGDFYEQFPPENRLIYDKFSPIQFSIAVNSYPGFGSYLYLSALGTSFDNGREEKRLLMFEISQDGCVELYDVEPDSFKNIEICTRIEYVPILVE
ncbi:hypothetical protein M0R04_02495 [Candidatus Dojkabacteria bacterium]|jgi:hypothetical protein|nr:hypothetical protein [Candidatus Dojkabacteria bacterium]